MSQRFAIIAGISALLGAALVAGGLFLFGVLGGDGSGSSDDDVLQVQLAADTASVTRDLEQSAGDIADDHSTSVGSLRQRSTALLGKIATLGKDPIVARPLRLANQANLSAAVALETVEDRVDEGRGAIDQEDVASDEASDRLASLSDTVGSVDSDIATAEGRASSAITQLGLAISAIRTSLDEGNRLTDQMRVQLENAQSNLSTMKSELRTSIDALQDATASLGDELSSRSEELKPDVVLDCPELTAHSGAGLYDVSVRNISCSEAGALLGDFGPPAGFSCTELDHGYETSTMRCESGDQAIRYSVGA